MLPCTVNVLFTATPIKAQHNSAATNGTTSLNKPRVQIIKPQLTTKEKQDPTITKDMFQNYYTKKGNLSHPRDYVRNKPAA